MGYFSYCVLVEKIGFLGRKKNDDYILKMFCMENFIIKLCNFLCSMVNKYLMELRVCFYSIGNKY